MAKVEVEGMEQLKRKLDQLGVKAEVVERAALRQAGNLVKDKMKDNVNRSDKDQPHIQDNITVRTKEEHGHFVAEVGPNKKVAWRAKFLEFGTSKMSPKPFIQNALIENEREVMKLLAESLKKGLGL